MKATIICLVSALALASALNTAAPALRRDIIRQVNSNPASTWVAGVNRRFSKATIAEAQRYLGVKKNGFKLPEKKIAVDVNAIPASFDARVQWGKMCPSVSEIRDQSACGSCWAFGAVEAQTDRTCIQSQGKTTPHLSAEDMNSCCWECGMGCDGGDPGSAWQYWASTGVVDGGNYGSNGTCAPYTLETCEHHIPAKPPVPACPSDEYPTPACPTTCDNGETFSSAKHIGASAYSISSGVTPIQTEIMTNGPVEVAFTVYEDFLTYKSGVYQYQSGQELGGHAVKMLGWGVWTDGTTPYWIIANSWNPDWGNMGYFLILRGQDECGIEDDVCAGMAF